MAYQLSKKQTIKEIVACGKDPIYFPKQLCKDFSHPMHGSIAFKTYDFQTQLLKDFNDYRFNVILKARQLGISTITAGYIVWMMLFHKDKNILVMATKFSTAGNLVKKVKNIMKNLPDWLKIAEIKIDNRTSFELTNGSQIKASSTSGDAGRSEALSLLVLDEAAHIEGLDDCGLAYILRYLPVDVALRFQPQMVLETGFIRHMLNPNKAIMIFIQHVLHGTYTQSATKNGLKKKLAICRAGKLHKS
jgi:hypothetical protein